MSTKPMKPLPQQKVQVDLQEAEKAVTPTDLPGVSQKYKEEGHNVVADFICPTPEARSLFPADYIVWMDTIKKGRFEDTNQMFVKPKKYHFKITTVDAKLWAPQIAEKIK